MPTIKKKTLREKPVKWNNEKQIKNTEFYNSMAWNRLRLTFLSRHPLCDECLKHNVVKPAADIHHKVPFRRGKTDIEQWQLFLDENNLMAVCEECHLALHFKDKKYHLNSLDNLTDKEYEEAHKIN